MPILPFERSYWVIPGKISLSFDGAGELLRSSFAVSVIDYPNCIGGYAQ